VTSERDEVLRATRTRHAHAPGRVVPRGPATRPKRWLTATATALAHVSEAACREPSRAPPRRRVPVYDFCGWVRTSMGVYATRDAVHGRSWPRVVCVEGGDARGPRARPVGRESRQEPPTGGRRGGPIVASSGACGAPRCARPCRPCHPGCARGRYSRPRVPLGEDTRAPPRRRDAARFSGALCVSTCGRPVKPQRAP